MTVRARGSTGESLSLVLGCPQHEQGSAWWWHRVASHLEEFGEELALTDIAGLAAQLTTDAPHVAASAHRLCAIHEEVQREVARLRLRVADQSGSRTAAPDVLGAIEALLRRVSTLHRLSSDLMLDAYERDIGGD